jgi:hypothetical protein
VALKFPRASRSSYLGRLYNGHVLCAVDYIFEDYFLTPGSNSSSHCFHNDMSKKTYFTISASLRIILRIVSLRSLAAAQRVFLSQIHLSMFKNTGSNPYPDPDKTARHETLR